MRVTVTLPADMVERLQQLGGGNVSAGVRALFARAEAPPLWVTLGGPDPAHAS